MDGAPKAIDTRVNLLNNSRHSHNFKFLEDLHV